jgi:hypothetical protein
MTFRVAAGPRTHRGKHELNGTVPSKLRASPVVSPILIATDGRRLAVKYGAHAYDHWSVMSY